MPIAHAAQPRLRQGDRRVRRRDVAQRRGESRGCRHPDAVLERLQRDPVVVRGGVGEVAEQADHAEPADPLQPRRLREHHAVVLGGDAVARQPGLQLEMNADRAILGCRGRRLQQLIEVRHAELDTRRRRFDERRPGRVQPRQDGRHDAAAAQGERLTDVGDADSAGAALERGGRRAHGTVAVAVRLDDGDHLGVGQPAQVPHVRRDRADVDRRLPQHAAGRRLMRPRPRWPRVVGSGAAGRGSRVRRGIPRRLRHDERGREAARRATSRGAAR